MVRALVIRTAGINCDREMIRGFQAAGALVETVHLDALCADPSRLEEADMIGFPGGFSYGDDIASGRIFAMRVREFLYPALREAASRGCAMLGICNGFQVLVQSGLLPGATDLPETPPTPTLALAQNERARFVDDWIGMHLETDANCIWTEGLRRSWPEDTMILPVAHGEGRLVASSDAVLDDLERHHQVVFRYTDNFNGSDRSIAGLCDPTGRILGLMPHPDRYLEWTRHPRWTRLEEMSGDPPGLAMFRGAVERLAAEQRAATTPC
ncbi:MAG: phosphoribosylformylglycinamidine synthase subunit PurQ [Phycisphaerales bacterium]|nr:phosphoribosylformylglycinamidine synthase subunit PurQ [Phycisphaerales bacterium]